MDLLIVIILVGACAVVGATMPDRRLGSRYTNLDYGQVYDKRLKPITRKAAFWMELRVLLLLIALVALIAFLWLILMA
ncbi:hypothetical protein [Neorhizobium alkalisoli]|uniref:Uncharacterized protein n=1 Tax=Neorhizobium alkalisoli TaxID=528178 RepID=A0A561QH81_9HYPH|nr:hypothetical protein [Neorhizobium alkalisoli]TWF49711.1 hypothetical protein FHW37_10777 [Neorhizobium alkalisoli]